MTMIGRYRPECPRWWRGCLACREFMADRIRFCRAWNRRIYGVSVVEVVSEPDDPRAWWGYGQKKAPAGKPGLKKKVSLE